MSITVYSKNGCAQCKATKKWLTDRGLDYEEVNVSDHPERIAEVKDLGFNGLPVTKSGDLVFQGFNIPKLNELKAQVSK